MIVIIDGLFAIMIGHWKRINFLVYLAIIHNLLSLIQCWKDYHAIRTHF